MAFSDWQIKVIRDALAAYRLYTRGYNRASLPWVELTAKIESRANVNLGKDLLRQFVEGVSRKNPAKMRVPEQTTLEAIAGYLTHPDVRALSPDELQNEHAPAYQAPLLLLRYLKQELDQETLNPPPSINGSYQARCTLEDESPAMVTISLDCAAGDRLIAVTETLMRYHRKDRIFHPGRDKPGSENMKKRSRGWAILTPEDNLLAFMKEEPYGYNHYYLSFAIESDLWSQPAVNRFVLLRHDYPLEFEADDRTQDGALVQAREHASSNLLHFARVT